MVRLQFLHFSGNKIDLVCNLCYGKFIGDCATHQNLKIITEMELLQNKNIPKTKKAY